MKSADPLLVVEHLRVEFPTRRGTLTAVDDVSLSIAAGEVLGVVGESGAGMPTSRRRESARMRASLLVIGRWVRMVSSIWRPMV